jgi:hypothetical protein
MTGKADRRGARVQVYFHNPKILAALRRSARGEKVSLSRAAERAISAGLSLTMLEIRPIGRLSSERLEITHDEPRAISAKIGVQQLLVEFARAFFLRLPDAPRDEDPVIQAVAQARIEGLLSAAVGRIVAGSQAHLQADEPSGARTKAFVPGDMQAAK